MLTQSARGRLLGEALAAALDRFRANQTLDPSAVFGPLGECLFWLTALDSLLESVGNPAYGTARDQDVAGQAIPGLRWARNQIVHGVQVSGLAMIDPHNAVPGLAMPGMAMPGRGADLVWLAPNVISSQRQGKRRAEEVVYSQYLAGQSVRDTLVGAATYVRTEGGV